MTNGTDYVGGGATYFSKRGGYYDDRENDYQYVVFILIIYALSFVTLMVKYFWSSQSHRQYSELYDEFVRRDGFRDQRKMLVATTMTRAALAVKVN